MIKEAERLRKTKMMMVTYNTMLTTQLSLFWPLGVVCVCGVILVAIGVLSLLLLRGEHIPPENIKEQEIPPLSEQPEEIPWKLAAERDQIRICFFRTGAYAYVQELWVYMDQWVSVGSGERAEFALDPENRKLADVHFRMMLTGEQLCVAAGAKEVFVNGVPIQKLGIVPMQSGDLIRAGSYEYRVMFSADEKKENEI